MKKHLFVLICSIRTKQKFEGVYRSNRVVGGQCSLGCLVDKLINWCVLQSELLSRFLEGWQWNLYTRLLLRLDLCEIFSVAVFTVGRVKR